MRYRCNDSELSLNRVRQTFFGSVASGVGTNHCSGRESGAQPKTEGGQVGLCSQGAGWGAVDGKLPKEASGVRGLPAKLT